MIDNAPSAAVITCALCEVPAQLRNSHIIPEFLYESMYDDKHRFRVIDRNEKYHWLEQKGYRERLLCQQCETRLSVWEGYASSLLAGATPPRVERVERGVAWVSGIDYERFKLFQLSILWRAGLAKHSFFEFVTLGPHEERLRQMLLSSDPGAPNQYPCLMFHVHLDGKQPPVIVQPTKTRIENAAAFRFVFGGYFWAYAVATHTLSRGLTPAFLQRDGTMALAPTRDLSAAPFLRDFLRLRVR